VVLRRRRDRRTARRGLLGLRRHRGGARDPRALLSHRLGIDGAERGPARLARRRAARTGSAATTSGWSRSGRSRRPNWVAMLARRHFHEFGTTREQLAAIVLTERANAAKNPKAVYRDPLSIDDYLAARMISDPLGLYDCDVPIDGSTAVVVSRRDAARDRRRPPLGIEGDRLRPSRPSSLDQFDDLTTMAARDAAAMLCRAPISSPRTSTSRSSTTASASSPWSGSRRSGSVAAARAGRSSRAGIVSRSTASCRSTPTAVSYRREGCTATASSTRRASSSGAPRRAAGRGSAGSGGGRRRRRPLGGCLLLTR